MGLSSRHPAGSPHDSAAAVHAVAVAAVPDKSTGDNGVPSRTRLQLRDGQALVLLQKAALQQLGVHAWGRSKEQTHALDQWVKGCWRQELGLRSSRAPAAWVHACGQRGQGCILQASGCEFSVHACIMRSASLLYRTAPQTNVQVLCKAQRWAGWQLCGPHGLPKLQGGAYRPQSHPPWLPYGPHNDQYRQPAHPAPHRP